MPKLKHKEVKLNGYERKKKKRVIRVDERSAPMIYHINKLINLIDCTTEQKQVILPKSAEILNGFVLRVKNGEFTIRKNTNPKSLAATIIYTIIISHENMPRIGSIRICDKVGIANDLARTYNRYFKQLYPRLGTLNWELRKKEINNKIFQFISKNKKNFLKSFSQIGQNEVFFTRLITKISLFLKNETNLLKYLRKYQLKRIPPIIYDVAKKIYPKCKITQKEQDFFKKINNLYGFIYLVTNHGSKNNKVYVGQTIRTIEKEWGEILSHGNTLRRKREEVADQSIKTRYILNAVSKYPDNVWELKLLDIAYYHSELDKKEIYWIDEYDSTNPEKGYNLTTGGKTRGKLSSKAKKRVSKSVKKVWDTHGYKEKMSKKQKKSWGSEERREKASEVQTKGWADEERRKKHSKSQKKSWKDKEIRERRVEGMKKASVKRWEEPTEKMLEGLKKMHEKTRKDIPAIEEFLTDIKNTKNQRDFLSEDLFKKYGIKSHRTFNTRIKEILGGFGITNHGEAHRFFYDRSIEEVLKYLDNPKGFNLFRDPYIRQFFIDVKNSEKGKDLHEKYHVWHKQGLITKIKRIVGKFGISNYTDLKNFLKEKSIDESLKYFETLDKH